MKTIKLIDGISRELAFFTIPGNITKYQIEMELKKFKHVYQFENSNTINAERIFLDIYKVNY